MGTTIVRGTLSGGVQIEVHRSTLRTSSGLVRSGSATAAENGEPHGTGRDAALYRGLATTEVVAPPWLVYPLKRGTTMMTPSNLTSDVQRNGIPHFRSIDRAGSAALDAATRAHLGHHLRAWYGNPAEDKLPNSLARLLNRVAQIVRAHTEPIDRAFLDEMMTSIPS